jgi:hypothetical protein
VKAIDRVNSGQHITTRINQKFRIYKLTLAFSNVDVCTSSRFRRDHTVDPCVATRGMAEEFGHDINVNANLTANMHVHAGHCPSSELDRTATARKLVSRDSFCHGQQIRTIYLIIKSFRSKKKVRMQAGQQASYCYSLQQGYGKSMTPEIQAYQKVYLLRFAGAHDGVSPEV